jgi:regulator of RNase E activity RraA
MDMQGCAHGGGLGDVLVSWLIEAKAAGVLADGGMRDGGDLRSMGLPIFCAGPAAPPGPVAIMPAGVQELIGCGGLAIFPGDFIVGDDDGAMVCSSSNALGQ